MKSLLLYATQTTVVAGPSLTALIYLAVVGAVLLILFIVAQKYLVADGRILGLIGVVLGLLFLAYALHTFGIF